MNNRISGFRHPTRENIMGLFQKVQRQGGSVREQVRRYFDGLNGEQGVLSDNDLVNLQYTMINNCFYFCEYLLLNHVDKELAYNASDYYINQVSDIQTRKDAENFMEDVASTFFELLSKKRLVTYSFHVERSLQYIDQMLYTPLTLEDVAKAVSVTPQYLTTIFREETGVTLYQYIRRKKIDEAKMMLLYTDEPVTTIANSLGFNSSAHFSHAFKTITGYTPTKFRGSQSGMFPEQPEISAEKI